jgi:hypothetical protein
MSYTAVRQVTEKSACRAAGSGMMMSQRSFRMAVLGVVREEASHMSLDGVSERLADDEVVRLVVASGLAPDEDQARLLVDLDVVRVDKLSSAGYLVNVNGRQVVVSPSANMN